MTYKTKIRIGGVCGIVKNPGSFEVWMADASEPANLRINTQLPDIQDKIDAHSPRIFFRNESSIKIGQLSLKTNAFVCGERDTWRSVDLLGWDGVLSMGASAGQVMSTHALNLISLKTLSGGRGGSAERQYTSSIIEIKLGSDAIVAVKPWSDPVLFHHVPGGFALTQYVEIVKTRCEAPLKLSVERRLDAMREVLEIDGPTDGNLLSVDLRNEAVASQAYEVCSKGADFAAHYHVLSDPGALDPYYPHPSGFLEAARADDAQCSPVEYPFP